jgi:hypothetical protein
MSNYLNVFSLFEAASQAIKKNIRSDCVEASVAGTVIISIKFYADFSTSIALFASSAVSNAM